MKLTTGTIDRLFLFFGDPISFGNHVGDVRSIVNCRSVMSRRKAQRFQGIILRSISDRSQLMMQSDAWTDLERVLFSL
ncbi:hypothetical protein, partial [Chamaesiphon sp. OTE_20_metabat_361]|uniref:hypothetical protein n=1 Tax=Chamaesiphon sp. OTE_20_metabat_361 TaxID=2964689 RepID=UPI00286D3DE7